jgi:hypothetical protein
MGSSDTPRLAFAFIRRLEEYGAKASNQQTGLEGELGKLELEMRQDYPTIYWTLKEDSLHEFSAESRRPLASILRVRDLLREVFS